jgi:EPS-associated MarR family transcriptional regulator
MVSQRSEQQESTRLHILRLLSQNPEMSTRQLAEAVGVSNGTAYYVLKALVQKGMIKLSNFTASKHKGRYAYVLTLHGMSEKARMTTNFLKLKKLEYEELKREIEYLEKEIASQECRNSAHEGDWINSED